MFSLIFFFWGGGGELFLRVAGKIAKIVKMRTRKNFVPHGISSLLGLIQDLTKGGSEKRPPKAVAPRGVRGHAPRKIFNFRASEMRFPAFSGAI